MSMVTLKEILCYAAKGNCAIPAFNILNHLTLKGILEECVARRSPVIIQTSVSTVKAYGVAGLGAMVRAEAELADVPVTLHLDHCAEVDLAMRCADRGWTSVMLDASAKPFAENVRLTRAVVEYAHARGVSVEGELGAIAGVEEQVKVGAGDAHLADVGEAEAYVRETGIDAFAPAVGTAHGLYKGEPRLDFARFTEIRARVGGVPLVVHGGTGLSAAAFKEFIRLGAAKINISTAVKIAYLGSIRKYLDAAGSKAAPLVLDRAIVEAVRETAREHIELFGSAGVST